MTTEKPRWDRHAIKAELARRGFTYAAVEAKFGLHAGACRTGVRGANRKGAEAIAKVLDLPFRELFPDVYLRRPSETTPGKTGTASQKARRAADSARVA